MNDENTVANDLSISTCSYTQWVYCVITGISQYKVSPPITMSRCLNGVISDHGMGRYPFGFDPDTLIISGPGVSSDTRCHLIIIGLM